MKDKLMDIKNKMKPWHWWVLIVAAFSIIGFISIFGMTRETYQVLYSDLETSDSREIERYLAEEGIPYQVEEAGKIIKVPAEESARIKYQNLICSLGICSLLAVLKATSFTY